MIEHLAKCVSDLVERLHDAESDMDGVYWPLLREARDEIERLRAERDHYDRVSLQQATEIKRLREEISNIDVRATEMCAEIERLRANSRRQPRENC